MFIEKFNKEFLYVDDLSDACKFLENWKPHKEEIKYLNVGTGNDMKIKKLLKRLQKNVDFMERYYGILLSQMALQKKIDISKITCLGCEPNNKF